MIETFASQQATMADIQASLNHILHSLTELCARINKPPPTTPMQPINTPTPLLSPPSLPPSNPIKNPIPKPTTPDPYPIKYLTYSEMQQRRNHGLCLNCSEPYMPGHRCIHQRILLILPDDEQALQPINVGPIPNDYPQTISQPSDLDSPELPDLEPLFDQEIFYHALVGATNLKVMQLAASFLNKPTAALVDSSSTCNYLHPRTTIILGFKIDRSATFSNIRENGENMKSKGLSCNGHILFLFGLVEGKINIGESKPLIFDPGGTFAVEFTFETWYVYDDAQRVLILYHNPDSTSTPMPPTSDLEDKVNFEGMVMIRVHMNKTIWNLLQGLEESSKGLPGAE